MIIKEVAKNGQAVRVIKELDELTNWERENLILTAGTKITDYQNFVVNYNKKGELIRVNANEFTEAKSDAVDREIEKPDVLDVCQIRFGDPNSKEFKSTERKIARYARTYNI